MQGETARRLTAVGSFSLLVATVVLLASTDRLSFPQLHRRWLTFFSFLPLDVNVSLSLAPRRLTFCACRTGDAHALQRNLDAELGGPVLHAAPPGGAGARGRSFTSGPIELLQPKLLTAKLQANDDSENDIA